METILVLNVGSSSIKFALYPLIVSDEPLIRGTIKDIGHTPQLTAHDAEGRKLGTVQVLNLVSAAKPADHNELIRQLLDWIEHQNQGIKLIAAGHRVVHGGQRFTCPTIINKEIIAELESLISLAPLHQPHNLAAIKMIAAWKPELPQVACFDTSFHRTQSRLAQLFGLPRDLSEQGIIRYGFHGLSYDYIASALPDYLGEKSKGRIVVAHLGNGASMCAMKNRKSIATSMGFSAIHGLIMGQRCGSLDVGVVLYLMQNRGMSLEEVDHLLNYESGLLGVSGISSNMQVLLESSDPHAQEAINLFCYRAACELSSLVTALQGVDAIVFTAGIGENCAEIRRIICEHLVWLGIRVDQVANIANASKISKPGSSVDVLVIPTNEEVVIAEAASAMVKNVDIEQMT